VVEYVRIVPIVVVRFPRQKVARKANVVLAGLAIAEGEGLDFLRVQPVARGVEFEADWITVIVAVPPGDGVFRDGGRVEFEWLVCSVGEPHFLPQPRPEQEVLIDRRAESHESPSIL